MNSCASNDNKNNGALRKKMCTPKKRRQTTARHLTHSHADGVQQTTNANQHSPRPRILWKTVYGFRDGTIRTTATAQKTQKYPKRRTRNCSNNKRSQCLLSSTLMRARSLKMCTMPRLRLRTVCIYSDQPISIRMYASRMHLGILAHERYFAFDECIHQKLLWEFCLFSVFCAPSRISA